MLKGHAVISGVMTLKIETSLLFFEERAMDAMNICKR